LSTFDAVSRKGGSHQQFSLRQFSVRASTPAVPGFAVAE